MNKRILVSRRAHAKKRKNELCTQMAIGHTWSVKWMKGVPWLQNGANIPHTGVPWQKAPIMALSRTHLAHANGGMLGIHLWGAFGAVNWD